MSPWVCSWALISCIYLPAGQTSNSGGLNWIPPLPLLLAKPAVVDFELSNIPPSYPGQSSSLTVILSLHLIPHPTNHQCLPISVLNYYISQISSLFHAYHLYLNSGFPCLSPATQLQPPTHILLYFLSPHAALSKAFSGSQLSRSPQHPGQICTDPLSPDPTTLIGTTPHLKCYVKIWRASNPICNTETTWNSPHRECAFPFWCL